MEKKLTDQIVETAQKKPVKKEAPRTLSSGSFLLDLVLGGGFPIGKIVNLVGDKSTGKTLLAMEIIAKARKELGDKLKWFYNDAEAGFSFDTTDLYGFNILNESEDTYSETIEDFEADLNTRLNKLKDDEYLIYVLDSFDALTTIAEKERAEERRKALAAGKEPKGTYAMDKAKFASEFFRLQCKKIKKKNCLLIIVSQVRDNIGVMFGEKYKRSGGKSLDFYASQILWLAEAEKHKKKDIPVGITIKAIAKKNKYGKPFRKCFVNMLFDYGIDDIKTNIDYLYDLKTNTGKQTNPKVKWNEVEYSPKGLIKFIEENNMEKELMYEVAKKWDELELAISSQERKRRF